MMEDQPLEEELPALMNAGMSSRAAARIEQERHEAADPRYW